MPDIEGPYTVVPDFRVYVAGQGFREPTDADFRAAGWMPAAEVERLRALIRGVASGLTVHGLSDESAELLAMADGVPHVRLN